MRALSGREFARAIERKGWTLLRVHGSHHIYGKAGSVVRLTVPVHADHSLSDGLLAHLVKMAGLSEEDL